MIIKIDVDFEKQIKKNTEVLNKIPDWFEGFVKDSSKIWNEDLNNNVFKNSPTKGYLTNRTNRKNRFEYIDHKYNKKQNHIYAGYFFGRLANIFHNLKSPDRKKILIMNQAKRYFDKDNKVNNLFENLIEKIKRGLD